MVDDVSTHRTVDIALFDEPLLQLAHDVLAVVVALQVRNVRTNGTDHFRLVLVVRHFKHALNDVIGELEIVRRCFRLVQARNNLIAHHFAECVGVVLADDFFDESMSFVLCAFA